MSRLLFYVFFLFAKSYSVFADTEVGNLCFSDEKVIFSCLSDNNRTITLCSSPAFTASEGFLQYRFGIIGEIPEFIYPKVLKHPNELFFSGTVPYSGGGVSYLKFIRGNYSYSVFTGIGKGWKKEGVVVKKRGEDYSTILCHGEVVSELGPNLFEELNLPKDPDELEFEIP